MALRVWASSETVTVLGTGIRCPSFSSTPIIVSGTLSVVPESEKGAVGWETTSVSLIFTTRLPWEIATADMPTFSPTTIVPVRSLITTTAGISTLTSSFVISSIKPAIPVCLISLGTLTLTVPASTTAALSGKVALMALLIRSAVEKSLFLRLSVISLWPAMYSTKVAISSFSTVAPSGIRPTVWWFFVMEAFSPAAVQPPIETPPWATA